MSFYDRQNCSDFSTAAPVVDEARAWHDSKLWKASRMLNGSASRKFAQGFTKGFYYAPKEFNQRDYSRGYEAGRVARKAFEGR